MEQNCKMQISFLKIILFEEQLTKAQHLTKSPDFM